VVAVGAEIVDYLAQLGDQGVGHCVSWRCHGVRRGKRLGSSQTRFRASPYVSGCPK
jgi:hypothetical protein